MRRFYRYWFTPRFRFNRFQFNLFVLALFFTGTVFGIYLITAEVIVPKVFAATSPWTQTDWSGGTASGTVTGTVTTYESGSDVDVATAGQVSLSETSAWDSDYSSWQYRKKITFDNTTDTLGVTSEALTDFPVLIKLDSGSDIDYSKTEDSGEDIRFSDSDGANLSYEIEKWDESGTSYVWVKVPQVNIDSNSDYVYIYYGNSGASDGQSASSVWDDNYLGVWHLDEDQSGTGNAALYSDSSGSGNHGDDEVSSSDETGQIGDGQGFDGDDDRIEIDAALSDGDVGTVCVWFRPATVSGFQFIIGERADVRPSIIQSTDDLYFYWQTSGGGPVINKANVLTAEAWTHVCSVANVPSLTAYINGSSVGSSSSASTSDLDYWDVGAATTLYDFEGQIDEIRISNSVRSAAWIKASYLSQTDVFATFGSEAERFPSSGTLTSNVLDAELPATWGTLTYNSSGTGTVTVKARSDSSSDMSGATAWGSCSGISSSSDISSDGCVTDSDQYLQYQVTLESSGANTPVFEDISFAFITDQTAPTTNASSIAMAVSDGGRSVADGEWNNATTPYFSWTAGADNDGGSGLKGYCLYLGTSSSGNPATTSGLLQNSPVSTSGSTCGFIVSGTTVDLSDGSYLSSALVDGTTYYFNIKAIDNANNVFSGSSATFSFDHDETVPTNVAYVSTPSSNFGNVVDMSFSWPTSGGSAASDSNSTVLGYQYQLNGTGGTWLGTSTSSACGIDYIPAATGSYTFTDEQDSANVSTGTNVIYFRAVDTACNTSSVASYRTGSISYGGAAPSFTATCAASDGVTLTPTSSASNSFALSWDAATAADGQSVTNYYYMVNTSPPSTLSTITSSSTTYLDNDTSTSVSAGALTGSVRGSNTVYVVAADDADNYSASNCIKGVYTLNSTNPDPPKNLAASDASVKASELWRASLGWDVPDYAGTGTLTYKIQRSEDNSSWEDVTTTTGTSYIDTVSDSSQYYWRVGTYDTSSQSQNDISWATSVTLTPKGTFTEAADLASGPTSSGVTTKKATISWTTSRTSDSKVSYGLASGTYFDEEPSTSTQVTSHEINLTNLEPGTTYYYVAKWTDEDGNTGTSDEKTFTTEPPPTVSSVSESSLTIDSVLIKFKVKDASKAKLQFGTSTAYGGVSEVSTSSAEAEYTVQLTDLDDDTDYHYKLTLEDTEGEDYEFEDHTFTTLPRPRISTVTLQEAAGTAQPTVRVTWESNTAISSIVTYYPSGNPGAARDQVDVELLEGEHEALITGLLPNTQYQLIVKGVDTIGNEAQSDIQTFTTATDTRPPKISNLKVEGTVQKTTSTTQEPTAQLIVSWDTDEPGTSQIEFAEGTGTTYTQATQEDQNQTFNHLVIISGLTPSKAYHLRALSKDEGGNTGQSIDTVTITPKATTSALDLVIGNLSEVFGFLRGFRR